MEWGRERGEGGGGVGEGGREEVEWGREGEGEMRGRSCDGTLKSWNGMLITLIEPLNEQLTVSDKQ